MPHPLSCLALLAALFVNVFAAPAPAAEPLRVALPPAAPPPAGVEARAFTDDGIAPALARDLARALDRRLAPAMADAGPRRADMRLAPGADGLDTGYVSGLTVAMRTDTDIADWKGLAGRRVCFTASNAAARGLIDRLGGVAVPERAPALSLMKVRTGACDAALHEAALLAALFRQPEWQKFSASLPPRDPVPLRLEVADPGAVAGVRAALGPLVTPEAWQARTARWARNVAFEVWLEQEAPDCH